MAFAARKDDDDTWRLCLRKGETIRRAVFEDIQVGIGPFASQAKTKACADELNEKCWDAFARAVKAQDMPEWLATDVMDVITAHGGRHKIKQSGNGESKI